MADYEMTNPRYDSSSDSGSESDISESRVRKNNKKIDEKDAEEEELERLVLGTNTGFRDSLFQGDGIFGGAQDGTGDVAMDDGGLEDVDDSFLFAFDTGKSGEAPAAPKRSVAETEELPAWHDSDDDNITVSLAGALRLRKLRETEAEDVVQGRDYVRRLRQKYLGLSPYPEWAKQEQKAKKKSKKSRRAADESSDDSGTDSDADIEATPMNDFMRDINALTGRSSSGRRALQPTTINIQRIRDIPDQHKEAVESLSFHPKYPVLLSASSASIMHLHHIDPEAQPTPNPSLTSVQLKKVDIRNAEFLYPKGDDIFVAGRRKYFHHWDLLSGTVQKTSRIQGSSLGTKSMEKFRLSPCGRYMAIIGSKKKGGGVIFILSSTTMQTVTEARLTATHGICDIAWWSNGEGMTVLGRDGTVGEYNINERRFVATWTDQSGTHPTCIALGGHNGPEEYGQDAWVAIGANSGICNLYNRTALFEEIKNEKDLPTPTRSFENLITTITSVAFSPDGQLLAFASKEKPDQLKLVHVASQTIYANWPTAQTPLGRISAVAFGRKSDLLAVGNDVGKIRMWDILS